MGFMDFHFAIAMKYIQRSQGVLHTRGWFGLLKFICSRMVQFSEDLVFEKKLGGSMAEMPHSLGANYQTYLLKANNLKAPENRWLVQSVLHGESRQYLQGLQKEDCMVAIVQDKKVVHTSFVQFETSYKKLLNEANETPLIGNGQTSQKHRGKGLYPYAIVHCCHEIARRGCQRILISCAPDNTPSVSGIKKAGFVKVRRVKTLLVLTKFYFQKITPKNGMKNRYKAGLL